MGIFAKFVNKKGEVMNLNPSNYFLDKYISRDLSNLTIYNIPEISDENKQVEFVNTFILSSVFVSQVEEKDRIYIMNFLRKVESTRDCYLQAKENLSEYLQDTDRKRVSSYFSAIMKFEILISHIYQAYMIGKSLLKKDKLFIGGDGSG
jgi:hydroxymethylpyrimidine pyrophosphatase-like HAD family hydrolase